jgi:anaerobic ribonucleoside-triphosphate reductase
MNSKIIGNIQVDWEGDMDDTELASYVQRGKDKYGNNLRAIKCVIDGDYVEVDYTLKAKKFQRLRRITGYLVGDLSRWNDGKRAEEKDRVKHG